MSPRPLRASLAPVVLALPLCTVADAQRGLPAGPPVAGGSETGLFLREVYAHCGAGFVHASATTRTGGVIVPTQSCPFELTMPALPPGRVPIFDVVCVNYLADTVPASTSVSINGNVVALPLAGSGSPDLCWDRQNGLAYVEGFGPGLVNYGAVNTIDLACDGSLAGDPNSLGEGISILTVYAAPFTDGPIEYIEIYTGYTSTTSSGAPDFTTATLPLTCGYGGSTADLFVNALDGQSNGPGDLFYVNGVDVSGVFPGTAAAGNAWAGLDGPLPDENLYDGAQGDASPWMTHGDTSITIATDGFGDCLGHSLVAIRYTAYDTGCYGCNGTRYCNPAGGSPDNLATINIDHCFVDGGACDNFVTLHDAPPNQFTYLLVGEANGMVTDPPGAQGDLCVVGGCISRFVADAGATDATGFYATNIASSASGGAYGLPATCGGTMDSTETWYFQYWHRDGMNPSRFSEAIGVTFQTL